MTDFKHTIIALAVWGPVHRQRFTERFLPSLLNALPRDPSALRPKLVIFTTSEDASAIEVAVRMGEAARKVGLLMNGERPEVIRFVPNEHAGSSMVACQKEALRMAWREQSALAWCYPDTWLMPGSFNGVVNLVQQHVRACMFTSLSLHEEAAWQTIRANPWSAGDPLLASLRWDLIKHIHPTTLARTWNEHGEITGTSHHPGMLYRLPTAQMPLLVMNTFHYSPAWVFPRRLATDFKTSLDGDFIEHAGLSIEEIDILRRDFWFVECVEAAKVDWSDAAGGGLRQQPMGRPELQAWVKGNTTPINRMMFGVPLVLARDPAAKIDPADEANLLSALARQAHEMARI